MSMVEKLRHKPLADYIGFVFFLAFGVFIVVRAPRVGVLLLPGVLHELLTALAFLIRRPKKAHAAGVLARCAAYGGTFLFPAFLAGMAAANGDWLKFSSRSVLLSTGAVFWLWGSVICLVAMWRLRRSFSVEPQARELVVSGPYLFARHPIYASYLLQYLGIFVASLNLLFGAVLVVWFVLVRIRIHYEEAVLTKAFPVYREYQKKVGMFGPKLFARKPVPTRARAAAAAAGK